MLTTATELAHEESAWVDSRAVGRGGFGRDLKKDKDLKYPENLGTGYKWAAEKY